MGWTIRCWNFGCDKRFFTSQKRPSVFLGPHSLLCSGYRGCVRGLKRPKPKFNHHLPLSTVEAKNEWSCNSSPPVCLHVVDRENFPFACTHTDSFIGYSSSWFIEGILLYVSCYVDGVLALDLPPTTLLQGWCACFRPPAHNAVTAMVFLL
jgi:hypothetical protein